MAVQFCMGAIPAAVPLWVSQCERFVVQVRRESARLLPRETPSERVG